MHDYLTRKCVIYVIIKRSVSENAQNVKISCVLNVSRIITKTLLIHVLIVDIILESIVQNKILEDMLMGGDLT